MAEQVRPEPKNVLEQLCSLSGLWLNHEHSLSAHCMHTRLCIHTDPVPALREAQDPQGK